MYEGVMLLSYVNLCKVNKVAACAPGPTLKLQTDLCLRYDPWLRVCQHSAISQQFDWPDSLY